MFVRRRQIEVNDLSGGQYSVNKKIRFKTPTRRSDLCHYSDVYSCKGKINDVDTNDANEQIKNLTSKKNASLRSWISKINSTFTDNPEDLDIAISMLLFT